MMVAGGAEFSHLFYTEFGRPGPHTDPTRPRHTFVIHESTPAICISFLDKEKYGKFSRESGCRGKARRRKEVEALLCVSRN